MRRPHVSLTANASYEIYFNGVFRPSEGITTGGTSCSSPTFAGALADTEERLIASGALPADTAGKQRFGRLQDLIYSFNGDPTVFYDVTSGQIGDLPSGTLGQAGAGWDFATGWGAMNFEGFYTRVLNMARPTSLTLSASSVEGGSATKVTATLTLSKAAPPGGFVASVGASDGSIIVPATVTVAVGAKTANFSITANPVSANDKVTVSAGQFGVAGMATLTVTPPKASGLSLSSLSVVGGASLTGTVTIDQAAPTGGVTVTLGSSSSAVAAPANSTVSIAAGAKTASFSIATKPTTANTSVSLSALSGGTTKSASLTVDAPTLKSIVFSSTSIYAGGRSTGTVTLSGPAPSAGSKVALSLSSSTAATLSSSDVTVASGKTTATFTLTGKPVSANTTESVTASFGGSHTASVTIKPAILTGFAVNPTSVQGNGSNAVTGTVTLNGPAGPSAYVVTLTSSNSAASLPSSVSISAGSTSATFTFKPKAVSATTTVTLTAKLASASLTANLKITH